MEPLTLADRIAALRQEAPADQPGSLDRERLTHLPTTAKLQEALDAINARYELVSDRLSDHDELTTVEREHLHRLLVELRREQMWAEMRRGWGQARDEIQATRPAGCFCLGLGGRGRRYMRDQTPMWDVYCPACPEGQQQNIEHHEHLRELEQARQQRELGQLFEAAGIEDFASVSFETLSPEPSQRPVVEWLQAWADGNLDLPEEQPGILLYGEGGVGKTWFSVATMKRWQARTKEAALFIGSIDFLDALRASYRDRATADEQAILQKVRNVPLLVLDDLGAERLPEDERGDWIRERFLAVLNHRNRKRLPTLLTSNYNPSELNQRLRERLTWRIMEMCKVQEVAGGNRRDRKQLAATRKEIAASPRGGRT